MKKTIEDLKEYLLENFVDEFGDLAIRGLDFSDFDGDVVLTQIKVKNNLYQGNHKVKGDISQGYHEIEGNLFQSFQEVRGNLWQSDQNVESDLVQDSQTVKGNLYQGNQKVGGILHQNNPKPKELTLKEISDLLGYEVKIKGE